MVFILGIEIIFRINGNRFILQQLHSRHKVTQTSVDQCNYILNVGLGKDADTGSMNLEDCADCIGRF